MEQEGDSTRIMATMKLESVPELPRALSKIPAFPPVAIRVLNILSDEDEVELKKLLELLMIDPAFSAEILRAANSPMFGFGSQIDSVQHALVILGLERIKAVTLTVATRFYLQGVAKVDMLRRCWRYSVACALLADEVARCCGVFQDRAYTAALLHDVGRLGLLIAYPTEYTNLLFEANETLARGEAFDLLERERQQYGIDHCEAGRLLVLKWNLPSEFSVIAGYHGDFPPEGQFDLLTLVRLACGLANSLGFNVIEPPQSPTFVEMLERLPGHARHRFENDPEELRTTLNSKIESYDIQGFGENVTAIPKREEIRAEKPPQAARTAAEEPQSKQAVLSTPAAARRGEPEPQPAPDSLAPARPSPRVTGMDLTIFLLGTVLFGTIFSFALSYLVAK